MAIGRLLKRICEIDMSKLDVVDFNDLFKFGLQIMNDGPNNVPKKCR